jgi:AcrR family transcriptional regulator
LARQVLRLQALVISSFPFPPDKTMTSPRFYPPRQTRSQETLDRVLDAAEVVLEDKSFSETTVAEIMERAGVTVGAFYRRFADKDALLYLLDQRFFGEIRERGDELLAEQRWRGACVEDVLTAFATGAVQIYRSKRGIIRSLFLRARVDPVIQATSRQLNAHFILRLRTLLNDASRRDEITHPDPDRAIALGFVMFVGALRETTVFGETWADHQVLVSENLPEELARSYLSFLGAQWRADRNGFALHRPLVTLSSPLTAEMTPAVSLTT